VGADLVRPPPTPRSRSMFSFFIRPTRWLPSAASLKQPTACNWRSQKRTRPTWIARFYVTLHLAGLAPSPFRRRPPDNRSRQPAQFDRGPKPKGGVSRGLGVPVRGIQGSQATREWLTCLPGSQGDPNYAYSVVGILYSVGSWVVPHELGHNLGCAHDKANAASGAGAFPYSYGIGSPCRVTSIALSWPTRRELRSDVLLAQHHLSGSPDRRCPGE